MPTTSQSSPWAQRARHGCVLVALTMLSCSADERQPQPGARRLATTLDASTAWLEMDRGAARSTPAIPAARLTLDVDDVLARAKAAHSPPYPLPPRASSKLRGITLPSRRAPKVELRAPDRFVLRLPDPLPVPTPTVHGDVVLTGTGLWLGAVSARSGETAWALETTDMGPSSAACEGELCAWSTFSCTVIVTEATTGQVRWNAWLGPTVLAAPALSDGVVYAGFQAEVARTAPAGGLVSGGMAALDLSTGQERWRRWMDRDVIGAPVVAADSVHVATWGGTLYSFDRDSGRILSAHASFAAGPPTVDGSHLLHSRFRRDEAGAWSALVMSRQQRQHWALDDEAHRDAAQEERLSWIAPRAADATRWLYPDTRAARGPWPPVMADRWPAPSLRARAAAGPYSGHNLFQGWSLVQHGELTVAVLGDDLVAFDPSGVRWTKSLASTYQVASLAHHFNPALRHPVDWYRPALSGFPAASLALAGDRVVAVTLDGRILILDALAGTLLRQLEVGHPVATQPAVHDGWIYVGTLDGRLVGIDTGDRDLTGWSTFGGNARRDGNVGT